MFRVESGGTGSGTICRGQTPFLHTAVSDPLQKGVRSHAKREEGDQTPGCAQMVPDPLETPEKLKGGRREVSLRMMWPRQEKEPCLENQIRFSLDRYRFRQNIRVSHSPCRGQGMRTCKPSLQSYHCRVCTNPSSGQNPLAYSLLTYRPAEH